MASVDDLDVLSDEYNLDEIDGIQIFILQATVNVDAKPNFEFAKCWPFSLSLHSGQP